MRSPLPWPVFLLSLFACRCYTALVGVFTRCYAVQCLRFAAVEAGVGGGGEGVGCRGVYIRSADVCPSISLPALGIDRRLCVCVCVCL